MFNPEGFSHATIPIVEPKPEPEAVLTEQQLFDTTLVRIVNQGRPAVMGSFGEISPCRYRYNDLVCAVGVHLRDNEYWPSMEGHGVVELTRLGLIPNRLMPHRNLLVQMQIAHDDAASRNHDNFIPRFLSAYENLAKEWGFSTDTLVALRNRPQPTLEPAYAGS